MLLNEQFLINCDWLQYSVILEEDEPELICPSGFRLEIYPGNNVFRHRAMLFDGDGRKWLTMLWGPHSAVLDKRLMTVQVANSLLYDDMILWADSVLHEVVSCRFNSIGRLDVCCDFQVSSRLWRVLRGLAAGTVYVGGKSEGSVFWHLDETAGGRVPHCISWGSPSSGIRPKCYNKTLELDPKGDGSWEKPYIVSQWVSSGFDVRKVWRCEFSLHSKGRLQWDGRCLSLADAFDGAFLGSLFCSLYRSRFVCRYSDGKTRGHHNDDRLCTFLDIPAEDSLLNWKVSEATPKPSSEAITLLRRMMVQMESEVCQCSDVVFDAMANAVLRVCELPGVRAYFGWRFGREPEAYLQAMFDRSGSGIAYPDAKPSLSWL